MYYFWKRLHIGLESSHRLPIVAQRILCSERRILWSPKPNEHPAVSQSILKEQAYTIDKPVCWIHAFPQ